MILVSVLSPYWKYHTVFCNPDFKTCNSKYYKMHFSFIRNWILFLSSCGAASLWYVSNIKEPLPNSCYWTWININIRSAFSFLPPHSHNSYDWSRAVWTSQEWHAFCLTILSHTAKNLLFSWILVSNNLLSLNYSTDK